MNVLKQKLIFAVLIILAAFAWGCGQDSNDDSDDDSSTAVGTGTGSGSSGGTGDASVNLNVQGSSAGLALMATSISVIGKDGTATGTLSLIEASMVLREIEFETNDESSDAAAEDVKVEFEGPYMVDLLTNTVTPEPDTATLDSGVYDKIELDIHKVEDSDLDTLVINTTDPIYGNSIYVSGTYTPTGGSAVNFSLSYDLSEEFELTGPNGLTIDSGLNSDFVIAFRFVEWFDLTANDKNLDFNDLAAGAIDLNKDSEGNNSEIRSLIKENIKNSADYGKDEDGDGELAESEDTEQDEGEE